MFTDETTGTPQWVYVDDSVVSSVTYDPDRDLPISVGEVSITNVTSDSPEPDPVTSMYTSVATIASITMDFTFTCTGLSGGLTVVHDISVSGMYAGLLLIYHLVL